MGRFRTLAISISIFLLSMAVVSLLAGQPFAVAGDNTLFLDQAESPMASDEGYLRTKQVAINWNALENTRAKRIAINLFDGETITAEHDRTDPSTAAGGYVWVGHVPGDSTSAVTLSVVDEVLAGSITREGIEEYTIGHKNGRQVLQEIDVHGRIEVEGPDTLPAPLDSAQEAETGTFCEDGSRIDLLVAYTPQARDREGGTEYIEALINQRVAEMNTANEYSKLTFTYRLVHVMETSYVETGNVQIDLPRLKYYGDGYLDDVVKARDLHLADMVSLLIGQATESNSCGVAYAMASLSMAYASSAYNVTALDYEGPSTCNYLTMAHEFGHNMGNYHDRANATSSPVFPYSYGYQSPNNTFRTIMAYQCPDAYCPRIAFWSNPDVSYWEEPTGIDYEADPNHAADNARSMAQTALYVANFRENCSAPPTPTPTNTPTPTIEATASPTVTATVVTSTPPPNFTHHIALPLILNLEE
jgi:peptidyl-Asp metalloendopeptidase